jgi:pyruvate/2-oxoglutarate dehydrogenase complex dihydrolipoamide acyltransferase (E2) component
MHRAATPRDEPTHEVVKFAPLMRQTIDWLELSHRKHCMYALFEVDVTEARRAIKAHRARTGMPLSLTAFVIACFARAVAEDTAMQALRLGRKRLVLFADVDVGNMVERDVDGTPIPVPHIIRAANTRTMDDIEREISTARRDHPEGVALASVPKWLLPLATHGLAVWLALPPVLRRALWRLVLHDPYRRKRLVGTVGVTAVSMFGHGVGWAVAPMVHPVTLAIGGLNHRPNLCQDGIGTRDILCLTLIVDHDVIDGAPTARFIRRLTRSLEHGDGLSDLGTIVSETVRARRRERAAV